MAKAKDILKDIQSKGYRYSLVREVILDSIMQSHNPLSYFDFYRILSKRKISANKATVYRELAFLTRQKFICEIQFKDGIKYYEVMEDDHHHHIICNECQAVGHVNLKRDLDAEEKAIAKNNKFKVLTHSLAFYGLCQKCQL